MGDLAREALIEDVVLTACAEWWDSTPWSGVESFHYAVDVQRALESEGLWPCRWQVPSVEAVIRRLYELDEDRDLAIALGAP